MLKGLIKATVLSDTHRHIYKEKVKDSFYNEFVSKSINKILQWLKGMRRFQDKLYEGKIPPGEWLVSK